MIQAKIVKDTINEEGGVRITTFVTRTPMFIDAEIEKHRVISTSSTSSRFMPTNRFKKDLFIPDEIEAPWVDVSKARDVDDEYAKQFQQSVRELRGYAEECLIDHVGKVHKQHINRYLMPFCYQSKIWTATEWDNFFILRCPRDELASDLLKKAEAHYGSADGKLCCPEMRRIATLMMREYIKSEPVVSNCHIPLISAEEIEELGVEKSIKVSAARCARVSYDDINHSKSVKEDLDLHDKLRRNFHMTPFEHQAFYFSSGGNGYTHVDMEGNLWSANFKVWVQNRKIIEKETVK